MSIRIVIKCFLVGISCFLFSNHLFASNIEGIQVYQKNVHLLPEHKKKLAADINRYHNADNLWDVLREEFMLPHYEDIPAVQDKIEWFMNNQDFLLRSATRSAPYLYYILQQVKKRHLPAELVLLPIVESGYNPLAMSHAGASGIWQLMPNTATGLGVQSDWWYDGRRDVITSTRAALNYLAYLQRFFDGNWLLAIAAYNTGEGNILSAIKRNIRDGRDTDFWSLPVAQETRDYVPSLLALAVIISNPDQYPIYFPPVRNAPYLAQVDVGTQINLKYAAMLAGLSDQRMKQLNPGFNRPSSSSRGPYRLTLPIENIEKFTENLSLSPFGQQPKINWTHYRVKSGDTLALVAKKFTTTPTALRKLNHLNPKTTHLAHGSNLLIPTHKANTVSDPDIAPTLTLKKAPLAKITQQLYNNKNEENIITLETAGKKYTLQPGDTIYMVRLKDTTESIAKRFSISANALRAANQLHNRHIIPGERLVIPTHAPTSIAIVKTKTPSISNDLAPGDTLYMVRRGDTISKIAQKFHTSPAAIRLSNLTDDSGIQEGDRLIIPTGKRSA